MNKNDFNVYNIQNIRKIGKDTMEQVIEVERIRRITGYITGDIKYWNNGKKAELKDRVKHIGSGKVD